MVSLSSLRSMFIALGLQTYALSTTITQKITYTTMVICMVDGVMQADTSGEEDRELKVEGVQVISLFRPQGLVIIIS